MKKYTFLMLVGVMGIATNLAAQNAGGRHILSAAAGMNLFQHFGWVSNSYSELNTVNLKIKGTPAYGIAYDYGITPWFSLGVAGAYSNFTFIADQIVVPRELKGTYVGPIDLGMSRVSVGLRPLMHYGHLHRFDMYSGLRLGANIWTTGLTSAADLLPEEVDSFLRSTSTSFNFQVIPFGLRGYVTPNFAIGFETGFGAPHYAALQLSYRM